MSEPRTEPRTLSQEARERVTAWAECVQRLINAAPTEAVINETGIYWQPHSTPPDRKVIRTKARAVVVAWLDRDLAVLSSSIDRGTLDAAWGEAEAALPEGWRLYGVQYSGDEAWSGPVWRAWAGLVPYSKDDNPYRASVGSTPASALRALAAGLREAKS